MPGQQGLFSCVPERVTPPQPWLLPSPCLLGSGAGREGKEPRWRRVTEKHRDNQHTSEVLEEGEAASEVTAPWLSPAWPAIALLGPVGTRARLTARPPLQWHQYVPRRDSTTCPSLPSCSGHRGPRVGGIQRTFAPGEVGDAPLLTGVPFAGVVPAAEPGLPALSEAMLPLAVSVPCSSSCLPAARQLRWHQLSLPAVPALPAPGLSHGHSCWVLAAAEGSATETKVPESCAPPEWTPTAPGLVLPQEQLSSQVPGARGTEVQAGLQQIVSPGTSG